MPEFTAVGMLGFAKWTRGQQGRDNGAGHRLRSTHLSLHLTGHRSLHPWRQDNSSKTAGRPTEGSAQRRPLARQSVRSGHGRSNMTSQVHQLEIPGHSDACLYDLRIPGAGGRERLRVPAGQPQLHPGVKRHPCRPRATCPGPSAYPPPPLPLPLCLRPSILQAIARPYPPSSLSLGRADPRGQAPAGGCGLAARLATCPLPAVAAAVAWGVRAAGGRGGCARLLAVASDALDTTGAPASAAPMALRWLTG
jgi:hypothetical protein